MGKIFEIITLETTTRGSESVTSSYSLEISPEHDEEFDDFVSSHGASGFFFINQISEATRNSGWPWAIVAFEKEYRLSGHILGSRLSSVGVKFGAFNRESPEPNASPAIAFLLFGSKEIAQAHKEVSPLFKACWAALEAQPESRRWFCVADPLPQQWVETMENEDARLFFELIKNQQ